MDFDTDIDPYGFELIDPDPDGNKERIADFKTAIVIPDIDDDEVWKLETVMAESFFRLAYPEENESDPLAIRFLLYMESDGAEDYIAFRRTLGHLVPMYIADYVRRGDGSLTVPKSHIPYLTKLRDAFKEQADLVERLLTELPVVDTE